MKLEKWFVTWLGSLCLPPEFRGKSVVGKIFGSDKFDDGEEVKTARIVKSEGRCVTTMSGETYELGEPEQGYLDWMKREGIPFDADNPIKLVNEYKYPMVQGERKG